MGRAIGFWAVCLTICLSASANAAVTTYTSATAFAAAFNGYTFNFNAYDGFQGNSLTAHGVTFSNGNALTVENTLGPYSSDSLNSHSVGTLTMTLAPGTKAIGFYNTSYYDGDYESFTLTAAGTSVSSSYVTYPVTTFVGLISDTAFTTATLTEMGPTPDGFDLDNFSVTPEPTSLGILVFAPLLLRRPGRISQHNLVN